jgi:hypothetical protein
MNHPGVTGIATWTDGAVLTNPTDGTTLVSISGLSAGDYLVSIMGSSSVAWVYDFKLRTSGGATRKTQRFRGAANANEQIVIGSKLTVQALDEFICLLAEAGVTGTVQMSLVVQPWG